VNLPNIQNKDLFDYLGKNSRRDGDKLAAVGAKVSNAATINAPILDDCPINIECEIVDSIKTGSHEMFVGKILYVHAVASLVDKNGDIDFAAANLL
jgi:flavin reductase (DIM6/NTAB) family NADH-FMN oxidoreductase RutF